MQLYRPISYLYLLISLLHASCAHRAVTKTALKTTATNLKVAAEHSGYREVAYYETIASQCLEFAKKEFNRRDNDSADLFAESARLYSERAAELSKIEEHQRRVELFLEFESKGRFADVLHRLPISRSFKGTETRPQ